MLGFTIQTAAAQNPKFIVFITVFAILLPLYQHPEPYVLHFGPITKLDTASFFKDI
jgi:hypothetical protein